MEQLYILPHFIMATMLRHGRVAIISPAFGTENNFKEGKLIHKVIYSDSGLSARRSILCFSFGTEGQKGESETAWRGGERLMINPCELSVLWGPELEVLWAECCGRRRGGDSAVTHRRSCSRPKRPQRFLAHPSSLKAVVSTRSQNFLVKLPVVLSRNMNKNFIWKPWEQDRNETTQVSERATWVIITS